MGGFTVTTPVAGFTGDSAGVIFTDGEAIVPADNTAALAYFRAAGYGVEPISASSDESPAEQPKPTARGRKSGGSQS
jgi:hypothetical protein